MGQGISRVPEAPAIGSVAAGREPIGRYIAQQRRLRGIDLEELSARTRIPRRSLERLEAGAFDRSPDGFSRGFVRTVAEAIGLDADDAVARMLPEPDAAQLGPPRAALWLVAGACLALVAGVVLLVRAQTDDPAAAAASVSGLPVRRDYVRALAEANGIATSELAARDALLPPPPPPAEQEVVPVAKPAASAAPKVAPAPKPSQPAAARAAASAPTPAAAPPAPARPASPEEVAPAPAPTPAPEPSASAGPVSELGSPRTSSAAPIQAESEAPPAAIESEADVAPVLGEAPALEAVAPVDAETAETPAPTPNAEADD